jgi:hypothetical protein
MTYKEFINEGAGDGNLTITGLEVAELCGMGDIYRQGKELIAQEMKMTENFKSLTNRINELYKKKDTKIIYW